MAYMASTRIVRCVDVRCILGVFWQTINMALNGTLKGAIMLAWRTGQRSGSPFLWSDNRDTEAVLPKPSLEAIQARVHR